MHDSRVEAYTLLVERSIDVQPGWQVMVSSSPLVRPLIEEVVWAIARRGAYAFVRVSYDSISHAWLGEASGELAATAISTCRMAKSSSVPSRMPPRASLQLGSFPLLSGTNISRVHWDMIKDLRGGGQICCDGEVVQDNGVWTF